MHLPDNDHERGDFQPTNHERNASGDPRVPKTQEYNGPKNCDKHRQ